MLRQKTAWSYIPWVWEAAYNTLVRLQLKYAVAVWDPHAKVKTEQIENCSLDHL